MRSFTHDAMIACLAIDAESNDLLGGIITGPDALFPGDRPGLDPMCFPVALFTV